MSADAGAAMALLNHPVKGIALRAVELTAGYDSRPVIHGISIDVQPGEVVSIVGPNGSGKSTLLKAIVGLVEVMSGRVIVGDEDVTGWPSENLARIGVGYVPQVDDVFAPLTVRENLEMGAFVRGNGPSFASRVDEMFALFPRLRERRSQLAGSLSGGEQQMLAIARALISQPRLLIMDEPSLGLAPKVVHTLFEQIREINARGLSILMVEQNARQALKIAHYAYLLEVGRLAAEGPSAALMASEDVQRAYLGG